MLHTALIRCLRVLCGASLLHMPGPDVCVERRCSTLRVQAGTCGLCGAILLHTCACIRVCVACGGAALHTSVSSSLSRVVWSGIAPHGPQRMSCGSCVAQRCSTCRDLTLVWSAGAPHVGARRVLVACVGRERFLGRERSGSTDRGRITLSPSTCSSTLGDRFQADGLGSHSPPTRRPLLPQLRATGFTGLCAENRPPSTAQRAVSGLRAESPPSKGNA